MKGKKEWHASSNGPDVLDVAAMMRALETLHSAHIAVIVSPAGPGSPTSVEVVMSALLEVLPGSALSGGVACRGTYPDPAGRSFWGLCYNLCWQLDEELGKTYTNESLWK